jgi:hypothetical protein
VNHPPLHYHELPHLEVTMNRPLGNYWKGIVAHIGVAAVALQAWFGDTGNSHIGRADWVRLAIVELTALGVIAKASRRSTGLPARSRSPRTR